MASWTERRQMDGQTDRFPQCSTGLCLLWSCLLPYSPSARLVFKPQGWYLRLEVGIIALRLVFEPQGWCLSLEAGV